ncbi:phosphodiesterase/alkaline phosphatase D-like protein [Actinoplanes lutulentus]|uniref:PhoD-like phosphatase n=1 Tax=Actinoplanes lutulentus TaxID=1287878 RepID=A0A327ZAA1_9ACTN|nr:phosphodiesterase/alkaline phosphatase D-like protein [Actinoplanes lutulentus]RAK36532.1 PhoD-like phosphatase [Actinoplanes lutulentus]
MRPRAAYASAPADLFPVGVASGDPLPDAVILWTRLIKDGGLPRRPALQAAHAAFPWIVTWDDHETENNYATLIDETDDTGAKRQTPADFAKQRAAAYQAYYEHMPIRADLRPGSADLRIFRRFDYGRLVRFNVLDTRQYRTDQPGGFSGDFGLFEAGLANTAGTLTGEDQERWLLKGLDRSPARWNVIAQQVMMSRTRFPNPTGAGPTTLANLDQWDGYARSAPGCCSTCTTRRSLTRWCSPATSTPAGSAS